MQWRNLTSRIFILRGFSARKSVVIFSLIIGITLTLGIFAASLNQPGPSNFNLGTAASKPRGIANSPSTSPADLWSGTAYFERTKYTPADDCGGPCLVQEESLIQPPTQPANVVYMYYRPHLDDHWDVVGYNIGPIPLQTDGGVSLAYSTDGGATFKQANGGHSLPGPNPGDEGLNPGPANKNFCAWDSQHVIAPSVVYVNGVYYMVYEGATIGYATAYLYCPPGFYYTSGDIGLATSTDGFNWTKQGIILYHNPDPFSFEANNIGTPFVGYFNNQFYVFYHGDSGLFQVNQRNQIGMAYGQDLFHLTKLGNPVLPVDEGIGSWDAWTTSRASVIWDPSSSYYYMTFEGSQSVDCNVPIFGGVGNWGWGIARSKDLITWEKFPYNPIRQTYKGGCANDIPYIFQYGGAIRVYQSEPGQANILLTGSDPYLRIYQALSQCQTYHKLGYADGDGWAQSTGFILADYLCYGPYETALTPGNYAVNFQLMEDTTSGLNMRVATVTINDGRDRTHENVLFSYSMNRRDFNSGNTYQNFEGQFRATTGGAYEWRTWFTNAAYIRIHYVTVRSLDPTSTDATPPTTLMTALPTASPSPVTVSWSGSDSGTGIWYFEIQVADNTLGTGNLGYRQQVPFRAFTLTEYLATPTNSA